MSDILARLGVAPIVNAKGPATRLSGGILRPEVAQAMVEASQHCVDIARLQAAAGRYIAEVTGAQAGYVSAGAASGLMLATAACICGNDLAAMDRLPDTTGLKNEVIVARSHRNMYDHAVRTAGARLVEVGIADRYAGAGVRDAEPWEYEAAINERTAALYYVASRDNRPSLPEIVAVARKHGVPVIVDAADQLPPMSNLKRFIAEGADLVAFSGGKAIGGPQASGILAGRRDLIASVAMQHLDMDTAPSRWNPPADLIDRNTIAGMPRDGIGRICKVGKEEIAGLVAAIGLALEEDASGATRGRWTRLVREMAEGLQGVNNARIEVAEEGKLPFLHIHVDEAALGRSAESVLVELERGEPAIFLEPGRVEGGIISANPMCLKEGEPALIAQRMKAALRS
ncbi:MAG: aminotransferase class V-fold PLP-dependent enzyme [Proteobacteria bacterium]|nr:aminotransferase class V-fold PLP-dependent enzyme [Pseudomonadota bacterium]MDA1071077.1 aminotransferase class V-fold PLP-dependent enzyme [Pseudomonadota bacterium]